MNRTDREIDRLCLDVILLDGEQEAAPSLGDMARRAKVILDARKPRRRSPRKEVEPDQKAQRRAERMARLAEIRIALHEETGGTCAVCGQIVPFALMHAHHILSGPERQVEERQETMAPVHDRCHDWLHGKVGRDQRDALVALLGFCVATGRVAAASSTTKRIAKIDEARQHPSKETTP